MAKADTRKKILKAAERLFSESGYDGVPTKVIAKEAGITEMTLFNHFPTKELLYKTVATERYKVMDVTSVYPSLTFDDLEKDLMVVADKLIDNFMKNKFIMMMQLKEKKSFHAEGEDFRIEEDPFIIQLTPLFRTYVEKGMITGGAGDAALLFIATIKGLFYICIQDEKDEEDVRNLIEPYVTVFCHGKVIQ